MEEDASLVEIGPRFVLNLIKIFQGSFGGPTLYENPGFQSPNMVKSSSCLFTFFSTLLNCLLCLHLIFLFTHPQHRRGLRLAAAARVREKQMVKELQKMKRADAKEDVSGDITADVFLTPADEKPVHIQTEAPEPKVVKKNKHKAFKRQRLARR